jgi:hypothetical protein
MVRLLDSLSGEDNMNKYLMLSAAAALAATGANAGTFQHSFTFGTNSGGAYCDGGNTYTSGSTAWSWQHTNNNCASGVSFGQGILAKSGTFGKSANMSDNIESKNYGSNYVYLNYTLPGKMKNGKPWEIWVGFSGTTSIFAGGGPIINVSAASKQNHGGSKSTTTALKQLIAVHKANAGK